MMTDPIVDFRLDLELSEARQLLAELDHVEGEQVARLRTLLAEAVRSTEHPSPPPQPRFPELDEALRAMYLKDLRERLLSGRGGGSTP